ncbi:MAG: glycosyltransferase [Microcystaceae cyanobacterium]
MPEIVYDATLSFETTLFRTVKRFIIIDHSLANLQGHHYECSVSVAKAAARLGYQPIIIANRCFPPALFPDGVKILPRFEVDWFDNPIWLNSQDNNKRKIKQFLSYLQDNPVAQVAETIRQKVSDQIDYLNLTKPKFRLFLEKTQGSTGRLWQWIQKDVNLLGYIPFSNTAWGIFKIIFGLMRYIILIIFNKTLSLFIHFTEIEHETFEESLSKILKELNVNTGEEILIHTIGIRQVEAIYHYLEGQSLDQIPHIHLLLRRDIDDPLVTNAEGMGLKGCLNSFADNRLWPNKVRFYTDTKELLARYNGVSKVKLRQVPVPFQTEKLSITTKKQLNQPIHLVYLGDARYEKGYHHLPSIIQSLWDDYLSEDKIQFTIQSNFSVEGGEKDILLTRLQLEQYPSDKVKLIKEVMQTEDYYQLLLSADIVILPYNIVSYRHRTSGVLTESLAAGKPVIVPNHTWLGGQVDELRGRVYNNADEIGNKVKEILEDLDSFQAAATAFSQNWRQQNTPDTFLQCLLSELDSTTIEASPTIETAVTLREDSHKVIPKKINILCLVEGETLIQASPQQQRLLQHLTYLFKCHYEVSLLTFSKFPSYQGGNYEHFCNQINEIVNQFPFVNIWILDHDSFPCLPDNINPKTYLSLSRENKQNFIQDIVNYNSINIPENLTQHLRENSYDLVYTQSPISFNLIQQLGLTSSKTICEIDQLLSYQYGLQNHQEVNQEELAQEKELLTKFSAIITANSIQMVKLKEWLLHPKSYLVSQRDNSYIQDMNHCLNSILDAQVLALKQKNNIAILYPWGDILERKSGASQRVGLLINYLQAQGYNLWLMTTGEKQDFYQDNIHYSYYQQQFSEANLVNKVYRDAYQVWQTSLTLDKIDKQGIVPEADHWLPWIYHQFRFDDVFKKQIEAIADWATIIILEYPFWAAIVGEICQRKGVKLIITAHDVLSQQLPKDSQLRKIALAEEIQGLKQADQLVCVSTEDQAFFQQYGLDSLVIENPVKLPNQQMLKNTSIGDETQIKIKEPFCLFVGSQHLPNLEAVQQIRHIAKLTPSVQFIIVGSCCQSEENKNFLALGKVSQESLVYLYQQASLILSPLTSGTGSSLKIVEAMAYGKVVLGTVIAFRGYPVTSKVNCLVEDDFSCYPTLINQVLNEPNLMVKIGGNAKQFAKKYDYQTLYQSYVKLINTF